MRNMSQLPSLVQGRRGKSSVIDCLTLILWDREAKSQRSYTFAELTELVSKLRGTPVATATIQSVIYRRAEWFERSWEDGRLRWKLSPAAKIAVKTLSEESGASGRSPDKFKREKP